MKLRGFHRPIRKVTSRRGGTALAVAAAAGTLAIVALIGTLAIGPSFIPYTGETTGCTVESKDRTSGEDASMRIYTDCGVFIVKDEPIRLMFNSADRYGAIKVGETYDIEAVGFRIPLVSVFPNIITATR